MSSGNAPNVDKPNEGILGQIYNSGANMVNAATEKVNEMTSAASKEFNEQKMKGNVPGNDSIGDRVSGAFGAASDKIDETGHAANKKANKESI